MHESCEIAGTIVNVVFQNAENGYAVVRLSDDDGEVVTVVGCIPCAAAGEELLLTGRWEEHPRHGRQFSASEVERHLPTEETEILNYLASGVIRGVGPATAQRIVSSFGADAFYVLEHESERLAKLPGITARKAREIAAAFSEQTCIRRLMDFLTRYSLNVSLALTLYRAYGTRAVETVTADPYILCGELFGVPFSAADEIALALGFSAAAPSRYEAAILFELHHNEGNGHVFLPREKLIGATAQLLDTDTDAIEAALDTLTDRGEVVCRTVANVEACYLARRYEEETYVSGRLRAMLEAPPQRARGAARIIKDIEREQGIEYAPLQREAVELAAQESVLILTGGPGTGKTTSLRGIVTLFERMGLDVALAAPTGRAAMRMGELCGTEAQTLHRLLQASFNESTGEVVFAVDEDAPLTVDAVIVDEMSMVDLSLMAALLAALRPGCRLVMVGDGDQLPSVGAGNVFSDLIRSGCVPTITLRAVFRQAEKSAIVRNAHAVNVGTVPNLKNSSDEDFFFLPRRDSVRLVDTIVELCRTRLPEKMGFAPDDIQVLTPTRRGETGTVALNRALQAALNPPTPDKRERPFGEIVFREGDRVMQTKNDYDIVWKREDGTGGMGVFNGDIGRVLLVDNAQETLHIAFDDRVAVYAASMLHELDLAYAITVHKAQGSEYPAVIFAAAPCAPGLMVRGVLYTAITRARRLLIAVGDDTTIVRMTENERTARRYSGLRWRLKNGVDE